MTWYETVQTTTLEQGDLLPGISVLVALHSADGQDDGLSAELVTLNGIILTQTCDIENRKVTELLIGAVIDWDEMVAAESQRNPMIKAKAFREKLIEGSIPSMSLLHKNEMPPLNWSIVNFKQLFSVPLAAIESNALLLGSPRLRLKSPYKEHLAQAFARFFMRVGLPHTANEFKDYTGPG